MSAQPSPWINARGLVTVNASHLTPGTRPRVVFAGYRSDDDTEPAYASFTPQPVPQSGSITASFPLAALASYFTDGPQPLYKVEAWLIASYDRFNEPLMDSEGRPYWFTFDLFEYAT